MNTHDSHAAHGEDDAHAGHGSGALYFMIFVALCVLTAVSFASYYVFKDIPKVGWAVMMAVSCMKASLVILFFMHLLWEANWKYVLTFPAMCMSLFLMLMLVPDVGRRMYKYSPTRELHAAQPSSIVDHEHAGHDAADDHQGAAPHDRANSHDQTPHEKPAGGKPAH